MSCNEIFWDHSAGTDRGPPRLSVAEIVNNGTIITVVGRNSETDRPVHIHFDHRCFASFYTDWLVRGSPPVTWDADHGVISFANGGDDG